MSLSPTATIKAQLNASLGAKGPTYWTVLKQYLGGSISRIEFDEQIKDCLGQNAYLSACHPPP